MIASFLFPLSEAAIGKRVKRKKEKNKRSPKTKIMRAMINLQPEVYKAERPNAAGMGTRVAQLAMYVLFESGLQMLADNPTLYYKNSECTDLIASVPTTWDETKALAATVGEIAVVAKRKGDKWFVGGITNGKEEFREIELSLNFLHPGRKYQMTYFEDGINTGRQAMDYRRKTMQVGSEDRIKIKMARNGGWTSSIE